MDLTDHEETTTGAAAPSPTDASSSAEPPAREDKPKGLRDQIKAATKEYRDPANPRSRDEAGKFTQAAPASNETQRQPLADRGATASQPATAAHSSDGTPPGQPAATPQASSVEAPASLSKGIKDIWSTLDPRVQAEFVRRDNDGAEGVKKLQERIRPVDEVLAPIRPLLQQRGLTEAQAIKQLFDWQHALAGPNKIQAAQALLRSHNIDPSTFAAPQGAASRDGQDQTQPLHPLLQQLASRQESVEQTLQRQHAERTSAEIAAFAKDKPHFDRVKTAMGQMMAGGFATDLADAYNKAIWADPEVRADIQRESEEQRAASAAEAERKRVKDAADAEAERKRREAVELEKARRANVSPRGSTPSSAVAFGRKGSVSIRSTIDDAIKQQRGSV